MELQPQKLATELTASEEKMVPTIKVRVEAREYHAAVNGEPVFVYKAFLVVKGSDAFGSAAISQRTFAFELNEKDIEHLGIPAGAEGVKYNGGDYSFELPLRIIFKSTTHPNNDFGFTCKYELLSLNENGKRVIPHTDNFLPKVFRNMIIRNPDKMFKYLVLMDETTLGDLQAKLKSIEKQ